MRAALRKHMIDTRDNGFIPEGAAAEGWTASRDEAAYPLERVMVLADLATARDAANLPKFTQGLSDPNEVIRYWSALGCLMLREKAARANAAIAKALDDASPQVRVAAAEALCRTGDVDRGLPALRELLKHANPRVRLQAANALDHLGPLARPALPELRAAARDADDYVKRAARYTAAVLAGETPPGEGG
jgi:HEAT repeat protein